MALELEYSLKRKHHKSNYEWGPKMRKLKSLVTCLLGALTLTSCGSVSNNAQSEDMGEEKPVIMKEVKFDGIHVQTNDNTWSIALESYNVKKGSMVINGHFYVPAREKIRSIAELENKLNKPGETPPYVISYNESPNDLNSYVYSNIENTGWNLERITDESLCYFSLSIDISPLIENNKLLGRLIIGGYFNVFCVFNE